MRGSILLYFDGGDTSKTRKKATLSMRAYLSVREQEKLPFDTVLRCISAVKSSQKSTPNLALTSFGVPNTIEEDYIITGPFC